MSYLGLSVDGAIGGVLRAALTLYAGSVTNCSRTVECDLSGC